MGSNYLELGMPGRLTEELQVTYYLSLTADLQKYINYKACIKFVYEMEEHARNRSRISVYDVS